MLPDIRNSAKECKNNLFLSSLKLREEQQHFLKGKSHTKISGQGDEKEKKILQKLNFPPPPTVPGRGDFSGS